MSESFELRYTCMHLAQIGVILRRGFVDRCRCVLQQGRLLCLDVVQMFDYFGKQGGMSQMYAL